jgi:hypothetical protein
MGLSTCLHCGKRIHSSKRDAMLSNRRNGHRLRAYWSTECGAWHVAKVMR